MKVQEVVLTAAMELGIADAVRAYLDEGNETGKKQSELLLECFNLVENELALDYLPLRAEDTVDSASGKISYLMLRYAPVRVIKVTDEWDNSTAFSIFGRRAPTPVLSALWAPASTGTTSASAAHTTARPLWALPQSLALRQNRRRRMLCTASQNVERSSAQAIPALLWRVPQSLVLRL